MAIPSPQPFLAENPIVPVVVLDRVADALPTAKALAAGGIKAAEVTFRTPVAAECIAEMAKYPEITVGAGTVTTPEQARKAVEAGAKFLVSPGFSAKIADAAAELEVPFLPGIADPSDIMATLEYGLDTLKFFPAVPLGGLPLIKAMAAPFPQFKFMPTGGIGPKNIGEWLSEPIIASVGGSWMVTKQMVNNAEFEKITALSQEAMELVKEYRS
ncbi:bifunctional 4-hydroxy-2-oxoglutarate aldolase/2-dehydro-3-deoxy-phosphogluconate aldolase [Arcanobacterium hippocoleae]